MQNNSPPKSAINFFSSSLLIHRFFVNHPSTRHRPSLSHAPFFGLAFVLICKKKKNGSVPPFLFSYFSLSLLSLRELYTRFPSRHTSSLFPISYLSNIYFFAVLYFSTLYMSIFICIYIHVCIETYTLFKTHPLHIHPLCRFAHILYFFIFFAVIFIFLLRFLFYRSPEKRLGCRLSCGFSAPQFLRERETGFFLSANTPER